MGTNTRHSRHGHPWRLEPRPGRGHRRIRPSLATMAIAAAAALLLIAFVTVCVRSISFGGPAEPQLSTADTVPAGDVVLSVSMFADGRTHFYRSTTTTGHDTRFFVIKTPDGVVRTAFDACDSCFRAWRGFRQVGDRMICNACDRATLSQLVNVLHGECHPAPLEHILNGDRVLIRAAARESGDRYF